MKVYVASSFKLLDKVKLIANLLERKGFEITVKWWDRIYEIEGEHIKTSDLKESYKGLTPEEFYNKRETELSYYADFEGVLDAKIFIFVADDKPRKYNGANIELGIALGAYIKCFSIGCLENSVLYYQVEQCRGIYELIKKILRYKKFYDIIDDIEIDDMEN